MLWYYSSCRKLTQANVISRTIISLCAAFTVLSAFGPNVLLAQEDYSDVARQITEHLKFGEFSMASELAGTLSPQASDRELGRIAVAQANSGAIGPAANSLERIGNDMIRFKVLSQQLNFPNLGGQPFAGNGFGNNSGINNGNGQTAGGAGGVTEADFQPLINLVKSTIDPDSWDDANGDGTIQAYPAGVFVDSSGTLKKIKVDSKKSLKRLAQSSSNDSGNRLVARSSKHRKVSLNQLERAAQLAAAQGQPLSDDMKFLAGIHEIKYVMYLPESNDVVIAGPAGPWTLDVDGHALNIETGRPVLELDDLVVCLRNAQSKPLGNFGKFGCSITPRKQNLAATQQFISTSKLRGKAWRTKLRKTLGQQDIEVFGIDPATHAGRVLVEADYRMKLVAMGLEPTIPEVPSYLSRRDVGPNGEVDPFDVARWWFTMNYDEVITNEDRNVFTLGGTGVKVLSETEFLNQQGDRIHTGESNSTTSGFASDFTKHFEKMADEYPIYRRLKNLFDLSICSVLIRSQGLAEQADWNLTYFGNHPDFEGFTYHPPTASVPSQVDSVMNHRIIKRRKESSTVTHTLVGVSGGITFDAIDVINSKAKVMDQPAELEAVQKQATKSQNNSKAGNWWWD